jgi:hypothetical protein
MFSVEYHWSYLHLGNLLLRTWQSIITKLNILQFSSREVFSEEKTPLCFSWAVTRCYIWCHNRAICTKGRYHDVSAELFALRWVYDSVLAKLCGSVSLIQCTSRSVFSKASLMQCICPAVYTEVSSLPCINWAICSKMNLKQCAELLAPRWVHYHVPVGLLQCTGTCRAISVSWVHYSVPAELFALNKLHP